MTTHDDVIAALERAADLLQGLAIRDDTLADVATLRAHADTLRIGSTELACVLAYDRGHRDGMAQATALIVAWLRAGRNQTGAALVSVMLAREVEAGAHLVGRVEE